ncbi:hypothetical protein Sjap_009794 [Stephania japonica]|uniref:Small auxin up regulated protein n=1 Tax=Stephania japonica TaxID=461633 RepID=A0AAP0P333_9MAGN
MAMIKPKRLMEMARKWRKAAAIGRRRISLMQSSNVKVLGGNKSSDSIAEKGHFVVYTIDNVRFVIPLKFLSSDIFRELLRMSEEKFGLPGSGPITLPCDSVFLKCVVNGRCGSSSCSSFSVLEMMKQGLIQVS